jgi:type I restriction enzyme S subunit
MIDGLKAYPAYKDSGVPWLGEVPEHWAVLPFKRLASFKGGSGFPVDEQGQRSLDVPFYKVSDMNLLGNEKVMAVWNNAVSRETAARLGAMVFPAGTIIFPKVGGAMLTNKRRLLERPSCVDNNVMGCVVQRGDPIFVLLLLQKIDLGMIAKPGPVPAISEGEVREIKVAFPSLSEQSAIVRFLDHADRRIRRYIRAKKKLIELLNEQKQAIIHRAVTRGLAPNVRLKPSGVGWMADVPEHWEVRSAKYFYREIDERSATGEEELLSVSHITGVTPRSQKNITMFMALSYVGHKLCRPGDLVINTMWAWMAALGVAKQIGIVSPSYAVYRPLRTSKLLSEYADLLLRIRPYVSEYVCRSTGIRSSRLRLYPEHFLRIKLICPPAQEQQAILERITVETAASDRAIASAQREIDLFSEYRTRLIADLVTGKLDVREAAARLPEEDEEPEPLGEADALAEGNEEAESADLDAATEEAET